jgi:glucokinase
MGVLVFDVGGTRTKAGVERAGVLTTAGPAATDASNDAAAVVAQLVALGTGLTGGERPDAVGVGIRGLVDAGAGMITQVNPPLDCLIGRPLAAELSAAFDAPVQIENDARLHLLGELRRGCAQGVANVVYIALGTGTGVAVAIGGRILRGPHGTTGILGGHLTVEVDGAPCTCGNTGCLEAYVGKEAFLGDVRRRLAEHGASSLASGDVDATAVFAAARRGDPVATAATERFARYLAAGVVSLVHAYDPDVVVFGGGLGNAADVFLPHVREHLNEHAWTRPQGPARLETTNLGDAAALVGAVELTREGDWAW